MEFLNGREGRKGKTSCKTTDSPGPEREKTSSHEETGDTIPIQNSGKAVKPF